QRRPMAPTIRPTCSGLRWATHGTECTAPLTWDPCRPCVRAQRPSPETKHRRNAILKLSQLLLASSCSPAPARQLLLECERQQVGPRREHMAALDRYRAKLVAGQVHRL